MFSEITLVRAPVTPSEESKQTLPVPQGLVVPGTPVPHQTSVQKFAGKVSRKAHEYSPQIVLATSLFFILVALCAWELAQHETHELLSSQPEPTPDLKPAADCNGYHYQGPGQMPTLPQGCPVEDIPTS